MFTKPNHLRDRTTQRVAPLAALVVVLAGIAGAHVGDAKASALTQFSDGRRANAGLTCIATLSAGAITTSIRVDTAATQSGIYASYILSVNGQNLTPTSWALLPVGNVAGSSSPISVGRLGSSRFSLYVKFASNVNGRWEYSGWLKADAYKQSVVQAPGYSPDVETQYAGTSCYA